MRSTHGDPRAGHHGRVLLVGDKRPRKAAIFRCAEGEGSRGRESVWGPDQAWRHWPPHSPPAFSLPSRRRQRGPKPTPPTVSKSPGWAALPAPAGWGSWLLGGGVVWVFLSFLFCLCAINNGLVPCCSRGAGESLHLLEQPVPAGWVVGQRRRPLRRGVAGRHLLRRRRHRNVRSRERPHPRNLVDRYLASPCCRLIAFSFP